ncbi:MAG: hypothetical protein QW821_05405 [Candidatus Bathyarchaeia archaeon]
MIQKKPTRLKIATPCHSLHAKIGSQQKFIVLLEKARNLRTT